MEKFLAFNYKNEYFLFHFNTERKCVSIEFSFDLEYGWCSFYYFKHHEENEWVPLEWEDEKMIFFHEKNKMYSFELKNLYLKLMKKIKQDPKYRLKLLFYLDKDALRLWDECDREENNHGKI